MMCDELHQFPLEDLLETRFLQNYARDRAAPHRQVLPQEMREEGVQRQKPRDICW
jgi:hypothetical protein